MATKGVELASAYISLGISVDDVPEQVEKALKKVDTRRAGQRAGSQYSAGMSSEMSKGGTQGGRAAATAAGSAAGSQMGSAGRSAAAKFNQGFQSEAEARGARVGTAIGTVIGRGIGGAISLGITGAAGAATLAVGALGTSLYKGFQRLKNIDDATFKLQALGNSAADVEKIMKNAEESVKGTAFALDEAANAAASAVAAGVKPGEELAAYLSTIADTAAIAGTSFGEMASIFNKVKTNNKAYTDDLQMLADRGVPIFQYLQRQFGVTAADFQKMVEDGKVTSADFANALQNNLGGAAQKMGDSLSGSIANAEAALARLGAKLLDPVFGSAPGGISTLTEQLDKLGLWVDNNQDTIIGFWADSATAATYFGEAVTAVVAGTIGGLADLVNAFGDTLGGMTRGVAFVNRALGRDDIADQLDADADAMFGWADSLYEAERVALDAAEGLGGLRDGITQWKTDTQAATQVAQALGDALITFPEGQIRIDDVDVEASQKKLDELGIKIVELPDGSTTIEAKTEEGQKKIDAFLSANNPTAPATVPVEADTAPATQGIEAWKSLILGQPLQIPVQVAPGGTGSPILDSIPGAGGTGGGTGNPILDSIPSAARSGGGQGASLGLAVAGGGSYGLPAGTNTGGYGTGSSKTFPPWVMQIADAFGIKPSTYAGHQESHRNEPGYAPNPQGLNRGIDWSGPAENMQKFADYLKTVPGALEQVIWQNPNTGASVEIAGGRPAPGYFSGDLAGHQDHVHTRQSSPIPLPPWAMRRASGGSVNGPGTSRSDSIPAYLSNGEHVLNARDVAAMGGQGGVYAFRNALHRRNGGAIKSGQVIFPRDKNHSAGNTPGTIGLPDWSTPGQGWGAPPADWWLKPVDPDDVLFPEWWGQNPWGKHPLDKDRFRPFGFADGGAVDPELLKKQLEQQGLGAAKQPMPVMPPSGKMGEVSGLKPQQGFAPEGMPVEVPTGSGRTEGAIPAGAGFTGKTGGGMLGGLIAMGGEAAKGAIQMAADLGKMAASAAASAGSFGAGAAAGPAAGAGIQVGADIAKRGVDYGVEMANIGVGFLAEQLFPFGAPRWLSDVDPTAFMPNLGGGGLFATAAEAIAAGAGPGQADPNAVAHGQAMGAPPGPAPAPPGAAVAPHSNAGGVPAAPAPAAPPPPGPANPVAAPQNDPAAWLKSLGIFDSGGVLQPNSGAINLSKRPEYVLTGQQWKTMEATASNGARGTTTYNVQGVDLNEALRELKKVERRNSGPTMRGKAGL